MEDIIERKNAAAQAAWVDERVINFCPRPSLNYKGRLDNEAIIAYIKLSTQVAVTLRDGDPPLLPAPDTVGTVEKINSIIERDDALELEVLNSKKLHWFHGSREEEKYLRCFDNVPALGRNLIDLGLRRDPLSLGDSS